MRGGSKRNLRRLIKKEKAIYLEKFNRNPSRDESKAHCVSSLLKGKLHKSLTEILSVNLIIASNIDGVHGKVSLKKFKKLYDVLMDSIRTNGEENPEKGMRYALKTVKKRHFQAICVSKKKDASGDKN